MEVLWSGSITSPGFIYRRAEDWNHVIFFCEEKISLHLERPQPCHKANNEPGPFSFKKSLSGYNLINWNIKFWFQTFKNLSLLITLCNFNIFTNPIQRIPNFIRHFDTLNYESRELKIMISFGNYSPWNSLDSNWKDMIFLVIKLLLYTHLMVDGETGVSLREEVNDKQWRPYQHQWDVCHTGLENIRHEIIHSNFSMEPLHCGDIVFCY